MSCFQSTTKSLMATANRALVYDHDNLATGQVVQLAAKHAIRDAWSMRSSTTLRICRLLSEELEEAIDVLVRGRRCNLKLHRLKRLAHETFVALSALQSEALALSAQRQAAA
jgi:hypothetical protein